MAATKTATGMNCFAGRALALSRVDTDAPQITQKLLVNAGGWPAMKSAQALQKAGRVSDAEYKPPLLSGMVREGNRNLRSGLRVRSVSDVENLCTCRESREWGKICPHALAVGLAYIERVATESRPAATTAPSIAGVPPRLKPNFIEVGTGEAPFVALHLILPPNFESAWAKKQIMIVIEAEMGGQRKMLSALSATETYACDTFDLAAIDGLNQLDQSGELLAAMRILSRQDFLRLLPSLQGHPRITFGKSVPVEISPLHHRPKVVLERGTGDEISLRLVEEDKERLLVGQTEAWLKSGNRFVSLAEGLPSEFLSLTSGPLVLRGESALRFLALDAPRLKHWFEVETAAGFALPELRTATPEFALKIEGSMRELRAELRCRYTGGESLLLANAASEPSFFRDGKDPSIILSRDLEAEAAAVQRLESCGFARIAHQFVVRKENQIARFFAFEYPRLKAEWEVTLSAQAEKYRSELQPLAPAIDIVASGEDWFEMRYSLSSPNGETLPAGELQRMLRSGQNQIRLRNGQPGVLDAEAVADFEEVLRDCEPSQSQPGVYRIDRAHAGYVAATAEEAGARVADVRGALLKLAGDEAARQPETLKAELGELGKTLRAYQLTGVAWLSRLADNGLGGILADEMGLGKTVQTLAFLLARKQSQPALIVCPSSLLTNWQNEAQRFTPELKVMVLEGPERHERFTKIAQSDVVITSYALLQRDADKYKAVEFSSVILDEAQHIKNPETQNAQTAFALRARHRFVLTGTPIENSVRDLWSLMNFAVPGYLGSRADFRERYEQPRFRGAAPEVQRRLARRMRPFLLRRKKSEVARDLPEKIEQVLSCDLSPSQRSAYDGLLREIQIGVTSGEENQAATRMKMLLGLLRLRQVSCDLRLVSSDIEKENDPSGKMELLLELLEEAIDGGHRVLVFSQFVAMLSLIRQRLDCQSIAFAYLDGQTKDRQSVVDKFQRDRDIPVFLMSLKAGGVGLNLSAADTVIHFDPWWNYAVEAQATDRAHRIGQTRVVTSYKLIARDTVEEKIVKLQDRKRAASEGTIGGDEPLMSGLTTEDLEELLS
jgi:superfamily II DNA or RNA helicase